MCLAVQEPAGALLAAAAHTDGVLRGEVSFVVADAALPIDEGEAAPVVSVGFGYMGSPIAWGRTALLPIRTGRVWTAPTGGS